ncbi:MAG: mRNA surveillance protein pelota [Candidatus Altiarchaeota archaeon]|nr:mRNA surveillance protein pelota [Candidatus Altiarchaeota archaeon]
MKTLKLNKKEGHLVVLVESADDLWALSVVIKPGDLVGMKTVRKLKLLIGDNVEAEKKPMYLKLKVEKVEFHGFTADLRIKGAIVEGPENVKGGHTFTVAPHKKLDIWKSFGPEDLDLIKEHESKHPKVVVVLVDREGALMAFKNQQQFFPSKLPSKRDEKGDMDTKFKQFFAQISKALTLFEPEFVIVAGPGFVKEKLTPYLTSEGFRVTMDSVSSVSKGGLREVFSKGVIDRVAGQVREVEEEKAVEAIYVGIASNKKVFYGMKEVEKFSEQGNIESLTVASSLIGKLASEKKYNHLADIMKKVKYSGGSVQVVGVNKDAEKRLEGLGGIAGTRRW